MTKREFVRTAVISCIAVGIMFAVIELLKAIVRLFY